MNIGIDKISFYTSKFYLDLKVLEQERGNLQNEFYNKLGQKKMSVIPYYEDVVTMAANASIKLFENSIDLRKDIDLIIFATESSFDNSKASSIYLHKFFNIKRSVRVYEIKQACYSSTAALRIAIDFIVSNPNKKVLILASDISIYSLNSKAEPTQGCGAVAMVVSANPKIIYH